MPLYLAFVRNVGQEADEKNIYELFFTSNTDSVWGDDFGELPAAIAGDLKPYDDTYDCIKKIKADFKLITISESTQFSVQDAIDHCTCLAYEDISECEYPEYRLVLQFGDTLEDVEMSLSQKGVDFDADNK